MAFRFLNLDLQVLKGWTKEIDPTDAFIFGYVKRICATENEKVKRHRHNGYTWVSYPALLKSLPILKIKEQRLMDRLDNMCRANLLVKKRVLMKNKRFRAFFKISRLYWKMEQFYDSSNNDGKSS